MAERAGPPRGHLLVETRADPGHLRLRDPAGGADLLGRFGVDQRLQDELDALADHVDVAASAERVEQFGHVKLAKGHREASFSSLWSESRRSPGGPTSVVDAPGFYTTPRDVNVSDWRAEQ